MERFSLRKHVGLSLRKILKKTIPESQTPHNYGVSQTDVLFGLRNFKEGRLERSVWRARVLADFVTSNICIGHGLLAPLGLAFFPLLVCSYT